MVFLPVLERCSWWVFIVGHPKLSGRTAWKLWFILGEGLWYFERVLTPMYPQGRPTLTTFNLWTTTFNPLHIIWRKNITSITLYHIIKFVVPTRLQMCLRGMMKNIQENSHIYYHVKWCKIPWFEFPGESMVLYLEQRVRHQHNHPSTLPELSNSLMQE